DISQRMQNLPSVPSKYAVLKMTLPPTITCGTVHTLAELCQRISGADCGVSLGVRFHRNPSLEVAFTQFI
ncbi:MAG TPA: hypothetical protein PKO06_22770, partial [Candidatus Ozemobacteraceae bacterium]|nr:hypothetical protein [Candidatus Ozemobacteraceae bacterium]